MFDLFPARLVATLSPLVVLAVAISACASSSKDGTDSAGTARTDAAAVLVTRGCGRAVVVPRTDVRAGETAMQALRRVADVDAGSGGKFVTAIEGVGQNAKKKLAWLFYVNGAMAEKGAAEIKLSPGDVEWWDLHNWTRKCRVPADAR